MTKAELVTAVAEKTGETQKVVGTVLKEVLDAIAKADKTTLVGFGTFKETTRKARVGRNPQTGATIQIAEKTTLTFKASK